MVFTSQHVPKLSYGDTLSYTDRSYRVLDCLGHGSFGVVYAALELREGNKPPIPRAIKIMRNDNIILPLHHLREITTHLDVSKACHVATLDHVFWNRSYIYLVMDYYSGGNLYDFLRLRRWQPVAGNTPELKRVFLQILDGVAACHAKCIAHTDLKLTNVLVSGPDMAHVALTDFGLANRELHTDAFGRGTPQFLCPEAITMPSTGLYNSERNDIWALAVLLVHLATGRLPWHRACAADDPNFRAFCAAPEAFLATALPLAPALAAVLRQALALDPLAALPLAGLRRAIVRLDSFWQTEAEIAQGSGHVRDVWSAYRYGVGQPADADGHHPAYLELPPVVRPVVVEEVVVEVKKVTPKSLPPLTGSGSTGEDSEGPASELFKLSHIVRIAQGLWGDKAEGKGVFEDLTMEARVECVA
ncbi:kinase-like domain-containing protein [Epithele typhae]|uniref:kinase-like domain-containing protein n=1 Tax=Epithele typhae TaxID=378194 RepID=UPI002008B3E4|nr:kinase-like domain-containing protein [Epithele typhae]KAH9924307.1 kinase-like domain-containing protein [Epithele typhae]